MLRLAGTVTNPNTQISEATYRKTRHITNTERDTSAVPKALWFSPYRIPKSHKYVPESFFFGGGRFQMFICTKQQMQTLLYSK